MNLKLKSTEASEGRLTLAHPGATPGFDGRVQIYEIIDVPEGVPATEVVRLANGTAFLNNITSQPRYSFSFSELGIGRIVR